MQKVTPTHNTDSESDRTVEPGRAVESDNAVSHSIVIIGGGNAGISAAAQLRRAGERDIAIIEPSATHYYQPLWTLVGAGVAKASSTVRAEADVIPEGVTWVHDAASGVDPDAKLVELASGGSVQYETLVVASGLQLDLDAIPGMRHALRSDCVSTNYQFETAPKTWQLIRGLRSGTAVFTMPSNPIKCGGAPQKIAYLACDYWRKQGVLDQIQVILVLPTETMFAVPEFSRELEKAAADYGIEVMLSSEMTSIDADARTMVVTNVASGQTQELSFDIAHVAPRQSAPDWVKHSPLAKADDPGGYVAADQYTLQHPQFPDVFAVGDVAALPTSKTGAAIRKQVPVLVKNIRAHRAGRPLQARYNGYSSCPLTTSRSRMLLAEFDYDKRPAPSIPFIDTTKPRFDMWLLKRYGLPNLYWKAILTGRM